MANAPDGLERCSPAASEALGHQERPPDSRRGSAAGPRVYWGAQRTGADARQPVSEAVGGSQNVARAHEQVRCAGTVRHPGKRHAEGQADPSQASSSTRDADPHSPRSLPPKVRANTRFSREGPTFTSASQAEAFDLGLSADKRVCTSTKRPSSAATDCWVPARALRPVIPRCRCRERRKASDPRSAGTRQGRSGSCVPLPEGSLPSWPQRRWPKNEDARPTGARLSFQAARPRERPPLRPRRQPTFAVPARPRRAIPARQRRAGGAARRGSCARLHRRRAQSHCAPNAPRAELRSSILARLRQSFNSLLLRLRRSHSRLSCHSTNPGLEVRCSARAPPDNLHCGPSVCLIP